MISVPALRGKDYGKTKMSYPDYTETGSGLQYKVHLQIVVFLMVHIWENYYNIMYVCWQECL